VLVNLLIICTAYFYKGTHILTDDELLTTRVAVQLPTLTTCSIHDTALLHHGAANNAARGTGFHTHLNMRITEEPYEPKAEFVFLSFDHLRAD
jgi:hypothetical protein